MAQRVLFDHGEILHWMGAHHLFPVRGASDQELGFASHGALEGRTAIGWQIFFPALAHTDQVVVVDDESGEAKVLPHAEAIAQLGDAARKPGLLDEIRSAMSHRGKDATPPTQ